MDPDAPTGGARRGNRRWKRWLLFLALLPLIAFGLSNLALGSEWGRRWISSKIESRTTLETRIGGASWSPWNGVTFREIRIEQPAALKAGIAEPLLRISQLQVLPGWNGLLHGKADLREVRLVSPRLVVPLELVSHFAPILPPGPATATAANEETAKAMPSMAHNEPGETPPATLEPAPQMPQSTPAEQPATPTAAPAAASASPAPPPLPAKTGSTRPTDYLRISDASLAIVFGGIKTPLFEVRHVSGAIPVAGDPADAALQISGIEFLGKPAAADLKLPLRWQSPVLTVPTTDSQVAEISLKFGAQFGRVRSLPFAFEAIAPEQALKSFELPTGANLSAPALSSRVRAKGFLLTPSSWQMDFLIGAARPLVKAAGTETQFDQGQAVILLRGGTLSCVDARLVGERVSLLGNATILSNGRAAGVTRIVASPETTTALVNHLFPGLTAPPAFTPMATPQRVALDLEAFGTLGNLQFRLGKNGPVIGAAAAPAPITPP